MNRRTPHICRTVQNIITAAKAVLQNIEIQDRTEADNMQLTRAKFLLKQSIDEYEKDNRR